MLKICSLQHSSLNLVCWRFENFCLLTLTNFSKCQLGIFLTLYQLLGRNSILSNPCFVHFTTAGFHATVLASVVWWNFVSKNAKMTETIFCLNIQRQFFNFGFHDLFDAKLELSLQLKPLYQNRCLWIGPIYTIVTCQ